MKIFSAEQYYEHMILTILGLKIRYKNGKYCNPCEKTNYGNKHIYNNTDGCKIIYEELMRDKPSLIARFGSTELAVVKEYLDNKKAKVSFSDSVKINMNNNAGFFPTTDYMLSRFASELIDITKNLDVIGVWFLQGEEDVLNAKLVSLAAINPFLNSSWNKYLKNKKVLVIHPFVETMKSQYKKRKVLFKDHDTLPDCDLKFIKAIQSIADEKDVRFNDWFEALDYMKKEIDKVDFDIALVGCGAYGIFLADYCKKIGKKAVHVGGALQLLFGIKGKRWDNFDMYNENWVRPDEKERPKGLDSVEGGCYW